MKCLVLSWNYPPILGGIEHVAWQVTEGLHAKGHDITVITAGLQEGPDSESHVPFDIRRARRPGLPAFLAHAFTCGLREAVRQKPDVIICPSLTSAPVARLIAARHRVPYAILIHGSDVLVANAVYQWGLNYLLNQASLLFANSKNTARLLQSRGVSAKRIYIVNPGVDQPHTNAQSASTTISRLIESSKGNPILLTAGRLVRRKGILEFIEQVLPRIAEEHPRVRYWVVGSEPKNSLIHRERLLPQIQEAIDRTGQFDRVELLGRLSDADLAAAYAHASLFVLPCLENPHDVEGFGIVILEAALRGVPAAATLCGGIPDAIKDGTTGWLTPPGAPSALAAQISALLHDPEKLAVAGQAAQYRATHEFNWPHIVEKYEQALRTLVSPPP